MRCVYKDFRFKNNKTFNYCIYDQLYKLLPIITLNKAYQQNYSYQRVKYK